MKTISTLFTLLLFSLSAFAEESKAYTQWDTFRFTINNAKAKTFTKNMRSHIKKYHVKAPLKAKIYEVSYGPNANELIWVMGPVSFSEMDGRSDDKKHDEDWADNINPYITSYERAEIWRNMDGLVINNLAEDAPPTEKFIARYLTSSSNHEMAVKEYLLMQVKKTIEKIGKADYWAVMDNLFIQGNENGRHFMALSSFNSWAEMDDDWEFAKHFEEIYGENSFKAFQANYSEVFPNQWNEVISVNKEMSGL